jgi:hypothetical protein
MEHALATCLFVFSATGPSGARASSFTRFLDHTQRRITVGRIPLEKWSARRKNLYLTTHNIHERQISMPPGGIRTHNLSRWAAADLRLRQRAHWDRIATCKERKFRVIPFCYWLHVPRNVSDINWSLNGMPPTTKRAVQGEWCDDIGKSCPFLVRTKWCLLTTAGHIYWGLVSMVGHTVGAWWLWQNIHK